MQVFAIVACDKNRSIGRDNQIPWYLPADLRYFKKMTSGHFIVMGRKTYESIGMALPKRVNVVISHQENYKAEDCIVFPSFLDAIEFARKEGQRDVFVIGGGEIYRQALAVCSKIYYTEVDLVVPDATVFFPELSQTEWNLLSEEKHSSDEQNLYNYSFKVYERILPITVLDISSSNT